MSCKKAQEFFERQPVTIAETVDATKVRFGKTEAIELARERAKIVVFCRGKSVSAIDLTQATANDDELATALLGPTGNLKAPTILVGTTMIVGFNEAAYQDYLLKAKTVKRR